MSNCLEIDGVKIVKVDASTYTLSAYLRLNGGVRHLRKRDISQPLAMTILAAAPDMAGWRLAANALAGEAALRSEVILVP